MLTFWVPCRHDDSAVGGVVANLVDNVSKLINTLATVVAVHVLVLSTKMTPLEPIHWAKVTWNRLIYKYKTTHRLWITGCEFKAIPCFRESQIYGGIPDFMDGIPDFWGKWCHWNHMHRSKEIPRNTQIHHYCGSDRMFSDWFGLFWHVVWSV